MSSVGTLVGVGLDAVAVALLGWTTWVAVGRRERPSARPFAALCGSLTLWALFTLALEFSATSGDGAVATVVSLGGVGTALFIPVSLTVYALSYTGRGTGLTRWRAVALVGLLLPIPLALLVVAADMPTMLAEQTLAALIGTEILFMFVLFLYATSLLIGLGRNHDRISGLQMPLVTAGVAAPYIGGAVGSGGTAAGGLTAGLLVSGALFAVAIRRYPVLTGFPKAQHVARTRVVEALQEGVVVLDWDDRILDANARALDLFDRSQADLIGDHVEAVVDGIDGTDLSAGATGRVTLWTTDGRRLFRFSVSAVDDSVGDTAPVARAVVLRDVTDRQTREQRLAVLNRILRHNVRNELDVVLAHADRIDDDDVRAAIRDSATDLVDLGEKARDAQDVMSARLDAPDTVDLAQVAREVTERYRSEYPGADVSLACPDELRVSTHPTVVRQLLSELVDNALEHADGCSPTVEIGLQTGTDSAAELTVADEGPGIPDHERQILSNGAETQFEHGQGVGLWVVNWAVTQLGGDLNFRENDPAGSVVTVRLYGAGTGPNGTE